MNNLQNSTVCVYCGGEKQPGRYACQPCWSRLPAIYKTAIAEARHRALDWLAEHSPIRRPQFQSEEKQAS
jgi:hypothetical protein